MCSKGLRDFAAILDYLRLVWLFNSREIAPTVWFHHFGLEYRLATAAARRMLITLDLGQLDCIASRVVFVEKQASLS